MRRLLRRLRKFGILALASLAAGCTCIPVKVSVTYPDGRKMEAKGFYLNVFQNKSLKVGGLEYNVNNDPTVELVKEAYKLGEKAAVK